MISSDLAGAVVFILTASVFGIAGLNGFFRRTQLILDRPRNLVELRHRSIIILGSTRHTWELHNLDRAIVEPSDSGDNISYRPAMVISGELNAGTHPITLVYSGGSGAKRAAHAINDWLAPSLDSQPSTP